MKSRSSKAFLISVLLHLGVGVLGLFYWFSTAPMREESSINALFVREEKPKVRRVTPPKRAQLVRKRNRAVSQQRLKILTSVIERPFVKAEKVETRYKSRLVKFIEAQEGPQRIVYCVDLSTSMQNLPPHKLKKIIDLMRDSLTFLEPHDSFNIMAFSTELIVYREKFVPVTDETVAASSNYLADIQSHIHTKGTDHDMLTALTEIARRRVRRLLSFLVTAFLQLSRDRI